MLNPNLIFYHFLSVSLSAPAFELTGLLGVVAATLGTTAAVEAEDVGAEEGAEGADGVVEGTEPAEVSTPLLRGLLPLLLLSLSPPPLIEPSGPPLEDPLELLFPLIPRFPPLPPPLLFSPPTFGKPSVESTGADPSVGAVVEVEGAELVKVEGVELFVLLLLLLLLKLLGLLWVLILVLGFELLWLLFLIFGGNPVPVEIGAGGKLGKEVPAFEPGTTSALELGIGTETPSVVEAVAAGVELVEEGDGLIGVAFVDPGKGIVAAMTAGILLLREVISIETELSRLSRLSLLLL